MQNNKAVKHKHNSFTMCSNFVCLCYMNLYVYIRLYMIYVFILCWFFFDPGSGVLGLKLAACWGMPRSWNMFEYGTCWGKATSNLLQFSAVATLARRPVAGEWQAEALHNGRQDSLDEMMRWTKLFKYVHFCIKWRFRRRFQWGFCHLGAQRWHLRRDMVTFRAVNSCQRRWHSESLGGSDQLWEFLNVFHVVVTASHAVLELYAPQLFQKIKSSEEGENWNKPAQKTTKKSVNEEISWAQESELLFFVFSTARSVPHNSNSFHDFFLGSFSDSDFPAKPWMVSFSCVGLANVAAITLLCRAFLRRVLSLGCNIWQFTAFETNTEEAEANQGWVSFSMTWISMEFLDESTAYLTSRLPAFYVTFMCFNAWCVQAFWTPNTGYPTVRNACEWSVWASNICALGGSIVSACCFCTVWIKQKSGMVLAFWTCSFYWVIFIYILLWQL